MEKSSEVSGSSTFPNWYSPETGIYHSKHASVDLPTDPFVDVVSFIFSRKYDGVSAFIDSSSGYSVSYSELYPLVKSTASGLRNMGVSEGDVILLLLPNSIPFPVIFLAVLYLGAIVTPMNPLSSVSEIKKQVTDRNARLAFTEYEKIGSLKALGIPAIAVPEDLSNSNRVKFSSFYSILNGNFNVAQKPVIRQTDTAAILYSSGTTGSSKGVLLTHRNFIAVVELFVRFEASQYEYPSWKNVYLAVVPMFHIYGLSLFGLGLLSLGTTVVVMKKFNVNEMVRAVDRYGVTHFPAVPPLVIALTKAVEGVCGNAFRSLKQVSCGAAPLSRKFIRDFVKSLPNCDLIQGYGMTESTAVGTRGFNTEKFHKYSSVGLLAPNMEAKVVQGGDRAVLPPGCMGELWLRGPGVMKGYMNNLVATRETIDNDGWLHTGDIAHFDQDGYLYISDRIKEIIKYKGFQIAPADLEAVLICHPEILDVAVTAFKDEEFGEIPVAFVVRRRGSTLTEASIISYLAQQVSPYKKARKVFFTNSIPRSPAGKILRRKLRNSLTSRI